MFESVLCRLLTAKNNGTLLSTSRRSVSWSIGRVDEHQQQQYVTMTDQKLCTAKNTRLTQRFQQEQKQRIQYQVPGMFCMVCMYMYPCRMHTSLLSSPSSLEVYATFLSTAVHRLTHHGQVCVGDPVHVVGAARGGTHGPLHQRSGATGL